MVIMAIEAAKQLADAGKEISCFWIKEAAFKAAIRVPSNADGIETGFYMRPLQSADAKGTGSFAFKLCTFDSGTWTENCTGSIQIEYALEDGKTPNRKDTEIARELLSGQVDRYSVVQDAAVTPVEDAAVYELTARCGLEYGEAFQLVTSLAWHREDEGQVTSNVRRVSEGLETIHPTTLDAIVQTSIWTMTQSGTQIIPTMVPTQVKKLWVSQEGLSRLSSDVLRTHAARYEEPQLGTAVDIVAFDEGLQQKLVHIAGLRMNVVSAAGGDEEDTVTTSPEQRCHHLEWKPDLGLLSNEEITALCTKDDEGKAALGDFFTELDFLLTARVLQTLRQLPSEPVQPHLKKYIEWMVERKRLFDEGQVRFAFEPWRSRLDDTAYIQEVEERVLHTNKRGYLMATVARNLPFFLTGELDPLGFLFQGEQLKDYYFEQVGFNFYGFTNSFLTVSSSTIPTV